MTLAVNGASKLIYVARRNPGLAAEAFPARWKQHAALAGSISTVSNQVLAMAQCSRLLETAGLPTVFADYDGVSLITVADLEAVAASMRMPEHIATLLPDELRVFSDHVSHHSMTAREELLYGRPIAKWRGCICVIAGWPAPGSDDRSAGRRRWEALTRAVLTNDPVRQAVLRLVWNHVIEPAPRAPVFAGVGEVWFASLDEFAAFQTALVASGSGQVAHDLFDGDNGLTMLTRVTHAWVAPGPTTANAAQRADPAT